MEEWKKYCWVAYGEYADGSVIEKTFPFTSKNFSEEQEDQYAIECWLVERDVECLYYSVACIERI